MSHSSKSSEKSQIKRGVAFSSPHSTDSSLYDLNLSSPPNNLVTPLKDSATSTQETPRRSPHRSKSRHHKKSTPSPPSDALLFTSSSFGNVHSAVVSTALFSKD